MPKLSHIPLFEKLIDENTEESFEKTTKTLSSFEELQASIMEDLSRLLNTRLIAFWQDYAAKNQQTPFLYGVDIDAAMSTQNTSDMQVLEQHIETAVRNFEPRLINPQVHVQGTGNDPGTLFITIDAYLMMENRRVPLSFPIILNS